MGPASNANLQQHSWAVQARPKAQPILESPLLQGELGCLNTRISEECLETRSPGKGCKISQKMGTMFPITTKYFIALDQLPRN